MHKLIFALFIIILSHCSLYAQEYPIFEADTLIVTASRIPTSFSNLTRNIIIINRNDIENSLAHSIQGLLKYTAGVDIRQRGVSGVQADVSIRGTTFEQNLILIDGIKVSDPQTGHHNLDIPLTLNDIERIEILKGHGSRLYGPNAFGGVINIITRKDKNKIASTKITVGDYGFTEGNISFSFPIGISGHRLSLSKKTSRGYNDNTDFDIFLISGSSFIQLGSNETCLSFGYKNNKFGANSFYSDKFPNQWEHTETTFINTKTYLKNNIFSLTPKLYWREHKDYFILDKENPAFYQNEHTTDIYGMELQSTFISPLGLSALGSEIGEEKIKSTSLGEHSRTKGGFFFEHQFTFFKNIILGLGTFTYYYSDWGWETWTGIDCAFRFNENTKLYASIGEAFRVPTYTELYYDSPANKGNPNLKPEEALTYEIGLNWHKEYLQTNLSLFRREGYNLIDWIRYENTEPWEAQNTTKINTNGMEISIKFYPRNLIEFSPFSRININYSLLDSDKKIENFESKYVLDYLRHQFIFDIEHNLFYKVKQNWKLCYEDRLEYEQQIFVDTRISWKYKSIETFIEVTNLLDNTYTDISGVSMPGRWFKTGLQITSISK